MNDQTTAVATAKTIPAVPSGYVAEEVKFNFRTNKELGTKRESISLFLPMLSIDGLAAILNGGDEKQIALVLETLKSTIIDQAREQIDANEAITQDTLDFNKLTWDFISKLEPATRKGGGIPKEVWESFAQDYVEVMPGVTGKTVEQVTKASILLVNKLAAVKANKPVLKFLAEQLDLYFSHTTKAEEFAACYEFLKAKADTLLQASDEELLANL